jgi:hypothetical protein
MAFKTLLFALSAGIPLTLAATFDVQVGPEGQNVFEPKTITGAVAGDIVNFILHVLSSLPSSFTLILEQPPKLVHRYPFNL